MSNYMNPNYKLVIKVGHDLDFEPIPLDTGMHTTESKVESLPPNFVYTTEDPFYYGPALCEMLHYRTGAVMATVVEFLLISTGLLCIYNMGANVNQWVVVGWSAMFFFSTVTSLMVYVGLVKEMPKLIIPKIAILQIEIGLEMVVACVSIVAMSIGIEATNELFGVFIRVADMEDDFGPIWPFDIGVIAFFAAAVGIWMNVVVRGAYDYLLDKEYFNNAPSIEMAKSPKYE